MTESDDPHCVTSTQATGTVSQSHGGDPPFVSGIIFHKMQHYANIITHANDQIKTEPSCLETGNEILRSELQGMAKAMKENMEELIDSVNVLGSKVNQCISAVESEGQAKQHDEVSVVLDSVMQQHEVQQKELKEQLNTLQSEYDKAKDNLAMKKEELTELNNRHTKESDEVKATITKMDEEIKLKGDEIAVKQEELQRLQNDLKEKDVKIKELVAKHAAEQTSLQDEINRLEDKLNKQAKETFETDSKKDEEISILQTKLLKQQTELSKIQAEKRYYQGKCEVHEDNGDTIKKSLGTALSTASKAMDKIPDAATTTTRQSSWQGNRAEDAATTPATVPLKSEDKKDISEVTLSKSTSSSNDELAKPDSTT